VHNNVTKKQTNGLAMGAPTSTLAEAYIQNMEQKQICPILIKQQIIGFFRYVDDILLIYDQRKTNTVESLTEFNKQQHTIKFTTEKKLHKSIDFLCLSIHCREINFEFAVY
jgi:hypothetical protein